jgi:hypothetical protein
MSNAELTAEVHILLVTCVKSRTARPAAAKDLHTSALFRKDRAYAERAGDPWFILSAEHGLAAPKNGWRSDLSSHRRRSPGHLL